MLLHLFPKAGKSMALSCQKSDVTKTKKLLWLMLSWKKKDIFFIFLSCLKAEKKIWLYLANVPLSKKKQSLLVVNSMSKKNRYHFLRSMVRRHKKIYFFNEGNWWRQQVLMVIAIHRGKKTLRLFQSSFCRLEVSLAAARPKNVIFFFSGFREKKNMKIRQK